MGTLRLLETTGPVEGHNGEVFACSCTADSAFVLSGGWDGYLRLWDSTTGTQVAELSASPKPLSSCAVSPDGRVWLAGSMEGLLSVWDAVSHQITAHFVAHTRPISAITFHPDGQTFATSSWDRQLSVRKLSKERDGRTLVGHTDIVAGCSFTVDGKNLLSWSHDATVKLWEMDFGREVHTFTGHRDRVTSAALSPDGLWALSGGRDETLRLWSLETGTEAATVNLGAEVRLVLFLRDGGTVFVADALGRMFLLTLPAFEVMCQLDTRVSVQCGDLAPSGLQVAVGADDGRVHFVVLEGLEDAELVVTPTQTLKPASGLFGRLMGSTKLTRTYHYTCPACQQRVETATLPSQAVACPRCHRRLRVNQRVQVMAGC